MLKKLILLCVLLFSAAFQVVEPLPNSADPNANISWPPPVYVLRGEVEVRGTANVPGMNSYFLEFRRLNDDFTPMDDTVPWNPLTLPAQSAVVDAILGTWNTTMATVPDGLYELRLTINMNNAPAVHARVSPLRVENTLPPFLATPTAIALPTAASLPTQAQQFPTLLPTPTAFDLAPHAVARINANVRAGDSTAYEVIGGLEEGDEVNLIGRSSTGSGWWVIRMPNGQQGWVAGSVVIISGDTSSLPRMNPPWTPTPIASPTPPLPDATITNVNFDREIVEGESFQTLVTVRNNSPVPLPKVSVACNFTPMDAFFSGFIDGGLSGNSQITIALVVKLNEGGGDNVTANCAVDVNNEVAELDENNNFFNLTAHLSNP